VIFLSNRISKKVIVESKSQTTKKLIDGFKEQVKSYEERETAITSF
jgi:hypothetical protein